MNTGLEHLRASWRHFVGVAAVGLFIVVLTGSLVPRPAVSQAASPISGWAWSDTIGWISMSGSGYGLSMDATGVVSGYAWSDNIGWVSANAADLASCQAGAQSKVDFVAGMWNGWLRAIAGGSAQSGSWDGCISMSGAGYGVSFDPTTGKFGQTSKYAWEGNTDPGAAVIGWVDFSGVSGAPTSCTPSCSCAGNTLNCTLANCSTTSNLCSYQCSVNACIAPPTPMCNLSGGTNCIEVRPTLIGSSNVGATVSWDVSNVKNTCTVTGSNGDGTPPPQAGWNTVADGAGHAVGSRTSSILTAPVAFTLSCTGVDDKAYSWTAKAEFAPSFQEF